MAARGIRKGSTPALQSQAGRPTALLPSIELARDELGRRGPILDEETVHRMARQLGAEPPATRTRELRRRRAGQLPAGQEMAGQHVVAQTNGERFLDCSRAAHHVRLALQALGLSEAQRVATYRTSRHQLRAGRSREVGATLRRMAQAPPFDSAVWGEIESLRESARCHVALPAQDEGRQAGPGTGLPTLRGRFMSGTQRVTIFDVHQRNIPIDPYPGVILW